MNSFTLPMQPISRIAEPTLSPFEWFESYVNYSSRPSSRPPSGNSIADVVRQWIIRTDTYHDQKEQEVFSYKWSVIKIKIHERLEVDLPECRQCKGCRAWCAMVLWECFLHFRADHPEYLPHSIDEDFPTSETIRALIPALESDDRDQSLRLAMALAESLLKESRFYEADKLFDAVMQEMRHQDSIGDLTKGIRTLQAAELFIKNQQYIKGDELLRSALGSNFETLATVAMELTLDLDVEVDSFGVIKTIKGEYDSLEVRARLVAGFGETGDGQALVGNDLWLMGLSVLQKLHRHRKVVVLDDD